MLCTFLANCAILLQSGEAAILIDAPNGLRSSFDGVSPREYEKMLLGAEPYKDLCGMIFTHKHPDHYDSQRVRAIALARENVPAYAADDASPKRGAVRVGPFTVRYFTIGHSGAEFSNVPHRVLLVEAEEKRLYVTGDADWSKALHLPILQEFAPDAACWNPNYLSHEEGRELLQLLPKNFIYHMPVAAEDVLGIGRRCRREFAMHGEKLRAVLVDQYPSTFQI